MKSTPSPQEQEIIKLLEALKSVKVEYPPELLANRRTAFLVQLALMEKFSVTNFPSLENEKIIEILESLKPVKAEYPSILMAKQRAAFLKQVAKRRRASWLDSLRTAIQSRLSFNPGTSGTPMPNAIRTSLILVGIIAAAFAGILLGNLDRFTESARPHPTQEEFSHVVPIIPTATYEITETICTPDSTSPTCSTNGFDKDPDQAAWISKRADSWIKIDTGQTATIHMVEFDKENLGSSAGEFTISVALTDSQYKQVYDSKSDDTTGTVSEAETIQVSFEPELARYVLITVADPGIAINEVRAFAMIQPPTPTPYQIIGTTQEPPLSTLISSSTPLPTNTQTAMPTSTPSPSNTPSTTPTNTPLPSSTPTDVPTSTPLPTSTSLPTDTPLPTNTPLPTDTPLPTNTPLPTSTPVPASTPLPTDTPLPASTP